MVLFHLHSITAMDFVSCRTVTYKVRIVDTKLHNVKTRRFNYPAYLNPIPSEGPYNAT